MLTSESLAGGLLSAHVVPVVLWCLIVMSVITWALFAIKLMQFSRVRLMNSRFKRKFWVSQSMDQGRTLAASSSGPMARMARAGFAVVTGEDVTSNAPVLWDQVDRGERLQRALQRQITRERRALEAWVTVLASFGSTAPFVGLFGTVWGIMEALINISDAGSSGLAVVAGPVGHALIATGLGIAVAIPAVLIYNFLIRRLRSGVHSMKNFADDFYNLCQQSGFRIEPDEKEAHASAGAAVRPLRGESDIGQSINQA